jgi:formate hydrogenlyase subunit 6/NADH:ubiquinone oxidoreductase subunit I
MGAFKLGKMTFGSLFKKPETVMYPIETKPQPLGLKGHIRNDVDACILCGMCDRSCPTNCITVDKQAGTWSIDAFGCIQCGYCVTVCPKKCLYMEPDYHPADTQMAADVFVVPQQKKPEQKATDEKPATGAVEGAAATPEKDANTLSAPAQRDEQLESLLSLMEGDAAERVRAALNS